jgi:release factor glutamine methyltransferase
MSRQPLRLAILEAERVLAGAGVASPRIDAEMLAAHVIGVDRGRLMLHPLVDQPALEALRALVERRAAREPLQHLLGTAVLGPVEVAVGPGVFTPRPETELLLEWGLREIADVAAPVVVDLCTGTGALALAWARHNVAEHAAAGGTPVTLHAADVRSPDLLVELETRVDLVLCNPPYVPEGTPLPPEVTDWDPPAAVYGGPDGLEIIRAVVSASAALLRYGGGLAIEHDDTHGETVPAILRRRRVLTDVEEHHDLAGRPRFATARRRPLHST